MFQAKPVNSPSFSLRGNVKDNGMNQASQSYAVYSDSKPNDAKSADSLLHKYSGLAMRVQSSNSRQAITGKNPISCIDKVSKKIY